MSQYSADLTLSMLRQGGSPVVSALAVELLSLRAAVRRFIEATDAYAQGPWSSGLKLAELDEARDALRAEMASLDGNGGAS